MILCSADAPCIGSSSIINVFLFKPPRSYGYSFANDVVQLQTSRGNQICATYINRPGAKVTLLFSHGNAEDIDSAYRFMQRLSVVLNVSVVGYDYSGYGSSTGYPSERNCYADIECVFHYLTRVLDIAPETIVLYGRSLGSGPSCYLAQKAQRQGRPVAGLILHAAFASVLRVVMPLFLGTLLCDPFPNIDRIKGIDCPIFIAHGVKDSVVPYQHGVALFEALPHPDKACFFSSQGMHHNYFESSHTERSFIKALNLYLDEYILARRRCMKLSDEAARKATLYADL